MKNLYSKIRYYFRRLIGMDFKAWFEEINKIHNRSGKNRVYLLFDMILSSFRYGTGYVDYSEFEFYDLNHAQRSTYLTQSLSDRADLKFNDRKFKHYFDDKGQFANTFKDYLGREIIDLREADLSEFIEFANKHKHFFAKDFTEMAGRGISYIDIKEHDDLEKLYKQLIDNKQYVIEEFFKQHEEMQKLSLKSVNTIRMITFLDDHQKPHLLVSALKGGTDSMIDNIGAGGMYTILSEDGEIIYPMIDQNDHQYTVHPNTKEELIGFKVPFFKEAVELVEKASLVIPEIRYIGWDVAIGPNGPILIEGNSYSGPFQLIPSLTKDKTGILPKYEALMGDLRKK